MSESAKGCALAGCTSVQTPDKSNHTPSMAALNRTLYPAHLSSWPAAALQCFALRWRALMQPDMP
jgi:hypothetical protein